MNSSDFELLVRSGRSMLTLVLSSGPCVFCCPRMSPQRPGESSTVLQPSLLQPGFPQTFSPLSCQPGTESQVYHRGHKGGEALRIAE